MQMHESMERSLRNGRATLFYGTSLQDTDHSHCEESDSVRGPAGPAAVRAGGRQGMLPPGGDAGPQAGQEHDRRPQCRSRSRGGGGPLGRDTVSCPCGWGSVPSGGPGARPPSYSQQLYMFVTVSQGKTYSTQTLSISVRQGFQCKRTQDFITFYLAIKILLTKGRK